LARRPPGPLAAQAAAATAIVAAAAVPYAIVPIAMGVTLFGERPTRAQCLGVGCVIAWVVVLGAVT
jgi:hypothetical protein